MHFYEPTHKYFEKSLDENNNFISASGIIKLLENSYDNEYWSLYKAYEFLAWRLIKKEYYNIDKYLNDKPQELKDFFKELRKDYKIGDHKLFGYLRMFIDEKKAFKVQKYIKNAWRNINENSLIKGDALHNNKENIALSKDFVINPFTNTKLPVIHCNKWISKTTKIRTVDLHNLKDGYYPELILNWGNYLGQADKVYIQNGFLFIDDWKTNKKLNFENRFQKMLDPISHLDDCNWEHYKIQLSFYIWILDKYGYECMGSRLTHCIKDDNDINSDWQYKIYNFEHYTEEINNIIKFIETK